MSSMKKQPNPVEGSHFTDFIFKIQLKKKKKKSNTWKNDMNVTQREGKAVTFYPHGGYAYMYNAHDTNGFTTNEKPH